jgi:hypothetical protein
MARVSPEIRDLVAHRAQFCCEYCKSPQRFSSIAYEVDHIIARKHQGSDALENLALACLSCNRHKGSDLTTFDPLTGQLTCLFHPRQQRWGDHFELQGSLLVGQSDVGRSTVQLLQLNSSMRVQERSLLIARGLFPV